MASTWGDHLACEVCGQAYSALRTGETFASVKRMMLRDPGDPSSWVYRRRNGVLGFWHQLKLLAWNSHVAECWSERGRAPGTVRVGGGLKL